MKNTHINNEELSKITKKRKENQYAKKQCGSKCDNRR